MTRGKIISKVKKLIAVTAVILPLAFLYSCGNNEVHESEPIVASLDESLVKDKFRVSWGKSGTQYDTTYTINGKTSTLNPNLNYCLFDPATPADITIETADKSNKNNKATINLSIKEAISFMDIDAIEKDNRIDISIHNIEEKYTLYLDINGTIQKSDTSELSFNKSDIVNKKLSVSKRYESKDENTGTYNYEVSNYSNPLQIELANKPTVTFKPLDSTNYVIKSAGMGDFESYDIKLSDSKSFEFVENNVKETEMKTKCSIPTKDLPDNDLNLWVYCHGDKNKNHIICDTIVEKTYKCKSTVEYKIENEKIILDPSKDIVGYEITAKKYLANTEISEQILSNEIPNLVTGEYYNYDINAIYSEDSFSKTISTGWFTFAGTCEVTLLDEETAMYSIDSSAMNYDYKLVSELLYNDAVVATPAPENKGTIKLITLNDEKQSYLTNAGSYTLKTYIVPSGDYVGTLGNGETFRIYNSNYDIKKIYKTEAPNVIVEKEENGRNIKLSIQGYDEYLYEMPGVGYGSFEADGNGNNTYIITNKGLEYSQTEKTIKVYATKLGLGKDVLVLQSNSYVLSEIKTLKVAPDTMHVSIRGNVSYLQFPSNNTENYDRYVFTLYYKNSEGVKTLIGTKVTNVTNEISFDSFFEEGAKKKDGTYIVSAERYSTKVNELTSVAQNYEFEKIAAPVYNKAESDQSRVYWTCSDVSGYKIILNNITVEDNTFTNNLGIHEDELLPGVNTIEVYAYGTSKQLWSDPLVIKLYKFENPQLEIENSICKLAGDHSGINLSITFDLFLGEEHLENFTSTVSSLNLLTLTKAKDFDKDKDTTYKIHADVTGSSSEYTFIYGSTSEIEFTKLALPSMELGISATEKNGRSFWMKIDSREFIYYESSASLTGAGSGKHKATFYIAGDGVTTIDSNEIVKEFTI